MSKQKAYVMISKTNYEGNEHEEVCLHIIDGEGKKVGFVTVYAEGLIEMSVSNNTLENVEIGVEMIGTTDLQINIGQMSITGVS